MTRIDLLEMRARCALAMAERAVEPEPFLRQATSDALRLEKEEHTWAMAHAAHIRAGVAACNEDAEKAALGYLNRSAAQYDLAEMPLRGHLLRYQQSEVQAGADNMNLRCRAEQWIKRQGNRSRRGDEPACTLPAWQRSPTNRSRRPIEAAAWRLSRRNAALYAAPALAPQFVGREHELDLLRTLWRNGTRGVIALVGLGGAGKTAIAARFLEELVKGEQLSRPEGLFVWSFYHEPDAGYFLQELHRYFAPIDQAPTPAKGAALLHLLRDALEKGGPHLLVLDGLERVQRQGGSATEAFGQIEDPLLKGLLTRIAEGVGQTVALVTSRFPLVDLSSSLGEGYLHIDVEQLSHDAALALLRNHGVQGDDNALSTLVESFGAHALTLDHLGGLIGQFLGGDPEKAPEAPKFASPEHDRQALRLARLLHAYREHLPPSELALLCRVCLLERNVKADEVVPLFLCSPAVHLRTARELKAQVDQMPIPDGLPPPLALELGPAVLESITVALQEAPIAGPDHVFEESVRQSVAIIMERSRTSIEDDVEAVIRLYNDASFGQSIERRPLSLADQDELRDAIARFHEFCDHPLLPFKGPSAAMKSYLTKTWGAPPLPSTADLTPADVMHGLQRATLTLRRFAVKHFVLKRVYELCRLYQEKWRASGPLAMLEAEGLRQTLTALVDRHLILREPDGSLSVHPAVRDYFRQLATASEQGFWHHLIHEHFLSLVRRPGLRLPSEKASLDLVEEAIFHAIQAGESGTALQIYNQVLGGHRHLAWKLGEMARGLRIIRGFNPCPDRWALGWYLRALGELDLAYEENNLPFFRADMRLLQGRLVEVEREGDLARTEVARFLMGNTARLPADALGCVIPRVQILLCLGRFADAWLAAQPEQVYGMFGWEDDRARCQLFRADVASQLGDGPGAAQSLDAATGWILHSGSAEHLCVYHLWWARIAFRAQDFGPAQLAVDEGLRLARASGLRLYHVELLSLRAELFLAESQPQAAEQAAREARAIASAPECQYQWGRAAADHLLGHALLAQARLVEARAALLAARSLRKMLGDPRVEQTERLLARLA